MWSHVTFHPVSLVIIFGDSRVFCFLELIFLQLTQFLSDGVLNGFAFFEGIQVLKIIFQSVEELLGLVFTANFY